MTGVLKGADLRQFSSRPTVRRLREGYRIFVFREPSALSAADRDKIYNFLTEAATKVFGADKVPYWSSKRDNDFFSHVSVFGLVVAPDDAVCGWSGFHRKRFAGQHVIYADSSALLPEHQSKGVAMRMANVLYLEEFLRRHLHHTMWMVARTQSPMIHSGLTRSGGPDNVYPQPGKPVPAKIQRIGQAVADWLGQGAAFEPGLMRINDAYGSTTGTYKQRPVADVTEINDYFAEYIGADQALIVVCRINLVVAGSYWFKRSARKWWERLTGASGITPANVS
ncbi:hypothetical protein D5S17_04920 [Pseudonocardiaceae bacterium YIM PH 21723]|nr:hypothetical protein D5S17_04920 [Pseudonocardiaceae bacterium YIM PH 21723]